MTVEKLSEGKHKIVGKVVHLSPKYHQDSRRFRTMVKCEVDLELLNGDLVTGTLPRGLWEIKKGEFIELSANFKKSPFQFAGKKTTNWEYTNPRQAKKVGGF